MKLAGALMRSVSYRCLSTKAADIEMCSSVLALLFEELRCMPRISYAAQLEAIALLYSTYGYGTDGICTIDLLKLPTNIGWSQYKSLMHKLAQLQEG